MAKCVKSCETKGCDREVADDIVRVKVKSVSRRREWGFASASDDENFRGNTVLAA